MAIKGKIQIIFVPGKRLILSALSFWLAVSLACSFGAPGKNTPATGMATATKEPARLGFDRQNPFPRDQMVSAPNWEVRIVTVLRGEEAWSALQAASSKNDPAPQGWEYILLRLHVKSTYTDSGVHNINRCDFGITGDHRVMYNCATAVNQPSPSLDVNLDIGTEAEGWVAYLIGAGETNLELVVNEAYNPAKDKVRYIAIDDGASVAPTPDLSGIRPSTAGSSQADPARLNQKLTTQAWELAVMDVLRGDAAWEMVRNANPYNPPPRDGNEYLLVKLWVHFIASQDRAGAIDFTFFHTISNAGDNYNFPPAVAPYPRMDAYLFTGGEYQGWLLLQVTKGESNLLLVFEPFLDLTYDNQRFIKLFPD